MEPSYTTIISADCTPERAFAAISNPRAWWSAEIEGITDEVGAVFNYHFRDVHRCTLRVKELIPGQRVVWSVLENEFSFTKDRSEWKGTELVFEVARHEAATEVKFTHVGLVPEYECYDACTQGWHTYIGSSLQGLLETGQGQPNEGEAITASEQAAMGQAT